MDVSGATLEERLAGQHISAGSVLARAKPGRSVLTDAAESTAELAGKTTTGASMRREKNQWLIPVILAVGAAVALWYYWIQMAPPAAPAAPVTTPAPAPVPDEDLLGPLHPVEQTAIVEPASPNLVPLPSLADSDEYFKLELSSVFGSTLEAMLEESGMIERLVATVDNLPREHVAERIRPLAKLDDPFLVDGQGASGEFMINASNYQRYDGLVNLVEGADMQAVADLYVRYYPLFQRAYVDLGYPQGYFNDRLVEVIDHLLETPDLTGPIALVRPHVLYEFQDPALEGLSGGQKLMLRLGPKHAETVKTSLQELRALVTAM